MAVRGTFGRLPRAAPDLTSSIVALIREAQAQEASNMIDAWKNGGEVKGKGVSDDRLLKFIKMRRDQLDPSDPSWDEWDNRLTQYDFAIEESKVNLKYDEKKMTDTEVAQFYKHWAGKESVQKNSEFYRHLLDQAAKFRASAQQGRASSNAAAAAAAHNHWVNNVHRNQLQGGEYAENYLLAIAKSLQAAPLNADSFDDVYANSAAYQQVLDVIDTGKTDNPEIQGLIDEAVEKIRQTEPGWTWTQGNLDALFRKADRGHKRLIDNSTSPTERDGWRKRRTDMRYERTRIKQARANERIQIASDDFAVALDHCQGDSYCQRDALLVYRNALHKEAGNVLVTEGGDITLKNVDLRTSSALIATIKQADDLLAGKHVEPTPTQQAGKNAANGYTIFDAAAGNSEPAGFFADMGNGINDKVKTLDAGGWMMTQILHDDAGNPVLDGAGNPQYEYVVGGANTAPPDGMIPIEGARTFTDNSRTSSPSDWSSPGKPEPVKRTPTTYVQPSPATIVYTGPGGESLGPDDQKRVQAVAGSTQTAMPWIEMRGVPGPDGKVRTIYRTGDGSGGNPFMYHNQPPVPTGTKMDHGRPVIAVTPGLDADKNPVFKAEVGGLIVSVRGARQPTESGNMPLGTFTTSAASLVSDALRDVYATPGKDADKKAEGYVRDYSHTVANMPDMIPGPGGSVLPNPAKAAAGKDLNQLNQTLSLYKKGDMGKVLDGDYKAMNSRTPAQSAYDTQLAAHGFTAGKYGQGEMDRRVSLMTGIDSAEARIASRKNELIGVGLLYGGGAPPSELAKLGLDQSALDTAKKDVFNPDISVSSIKVPGMNPLVPPGGLERSYNPYAPDWMGALGTPPGVGTLAPTTAFPTAAGQLSPSSGGAYLGSPNLGPTTKTPEPAKVNNTVDHNQTDNDGNTPDAVLPGEAGAAMVEAKRKNKITKYGSTAY